MNGRTCGGLLGIKLEDRTAISKAAGGDGDFARAATTLIITDNALSESIARPERSERWPTDPPASP
jgi:hypothetical protein